jgi:putative ABC transport system substrate-binding protein
MRKAGVLSILFVVVLLAVAVIAEAQQPAKVPRIAYFSAGSASSQASRLEVFRQGLRDLGYAEGKDIVVEQRYAEGKLDRVAALATELVRLKLDVIVTGGPAATRAAKEATATIPIIMGFDYDPVGSGVVASLARPGGNVTGLSSLAPEISGKQLELLKEVLPRLSRVAVLGNSTEPGIGQLRKEAELVAGAFKVNLQYLDVLAPKDIRTAFQAAIKGRAEAVLALSSFVIISQRTEIADLAIENRLPAIYPWPEFVEDGGLMTYGPSSNDLFRRAASYVDKVLKGAKPADLPVEQPTKFEFVINLKAAKQIGLTIPPNVLARADRVIK